MKKIFALLLLVFVGLTFVGCTSASSLSSINTKFTSIVFAIDLDGSGLLERTNVEKTTAKTKIENLGETYSSLIKIRYFETLNNLEKAGKISSNQKVLYKNHLTSKTSWKENSFLIEFDFYSSTASRIFLTNSGYSGAINDEKAFSTITTEKFKNVFSQTINNATINLEQYFTNGVNEALFGIGAKEVEKINYYYLFISENSRLHSPNANEVVSLGDGSVFCFYGNQNTEIEFGFNVVQANVFAYYLLALGVTAGFATMYAVVVFILKRRNKNKLKKELDLNLDNKES